MNADFSEAVTLALLRASRLSKETAEQELDPFKEFISSSSCAEDFSESLLAALFFPLPERDLVESLVRSASARRAEEVTAFSSAADEVLLAIAFTAGTSSRPDNTFAERVLRVTSSLTFFALVWASLSPSPLSSLLFIASSSALGRRGVYLRLVRTTNSVSFSSLFTSAATLSIFAEEELVASPFVGASAFTRSAINDFISGAVYRAAVFPVRAEAFFPGAVTSVPGNTVSNRKAVSR